MKVNSIIKNISNLKFSFNRSAFIFFFFVLISLFFQLKFFITDQFQKILLQLIKYKQKILEQI